MFLLTPWDLTCEPLFTRPLQTISYKSWRVWASLLFPPFLLCLWIILLSRAHKTCFHRGGEGSCGSLEYQDSLRQRFRMESHYNPHRGAGIICAVCLWTHWWPGAYCRTHCLWHLGPERDGSGPIRSPLCHVPSDDHWQDFHDPNTDASPLSRPDDQLTSISMSTDINPYFRWFCILISIRVLWVYFCSSSNNSWIPSFSLSSLFLSFLVVPAGTEQLQRWDEFLSLKLRATERRPDSAWVTEPGRDQKDRLPSPYSNVSSPPLPLSLDLSTRPSTSNLNSFVSLWFKPGLL